MCAIAATVLGNAVLREDWQKVIPKAQGVALAKQSRLMAAWNSGANEAVSRCCSTHSRPWSDRIAAVSALHNCIKLLIQSGNFRQAADREKEVSTSSES